MERVNMDTYHEDKLEEIIAKLKIPDVQNRLKARREVKDTKKRYPDAKELIKKEVAAFLEDYRIGDRGLEAVKLFGEPIQLFASPEVSGGKWFSYEIGLDGQLYTRFNNQGGKGDAKLITAKEAANDYADCFSHVSLDKAKKVLPKLKQEIEGNILGYIERIEKALINM
jgi:hypothetical protein